MPKRSTKFYRKNEEEVMKSIGLKPTKNSGAGWIEKEDGQNDYVLCQLKSTDAQSIRIQQSDIRILEHNADVSHKLPMFAIQFLNTGEVWLMAKPVDFAEIANYIETGKCIVEDSLEAREETHVRVKKVIHSDENAREQFHKQNENKYKKEKTAW